MNSTELFSILCNTREIRKSEMAPRKPEKLISYYSAFTNLTSIEVNNVNVHNKGVNDVHVNTVGAKDVNRVGKRDFISIGCLNARSR